MKQVKRILNALTGYAGSSENPRATSMRLMGIITAFISQFSTIISFIVSKFMETPLDITPEQYVENMAGVIEPVTLIIAVTLWLIGAIRAVMNAPAVAGFLRQSTGRNDE